MTTVSARSAPLLAAAALAACLAVGPAGAQDAAAPETPVAAMPAPRGTPAYESGLLRLSEILGSIQYLRSLCGQSDETDSDETDSGESASGGSEWEWREAMQALIDSETEGEPDRREKLTAGYNRGYRAFAAVYNDCSASAVAAEARYRREGATLAEEIIARYGN